MKLARTNSISADKCVYVSSLATIYNIFYQWSDIVDGSQSYMFYEKLGKMGLVVTPAG